MFWLQATQSHDRRVPLSNRDLIVYLLCFRILTTSTNFFCIAVASFSNQRRQERVTDVNITFSSLHRPCQPCKNFTWPTNLTLVKHDFMFTNLRIRFNNIILDINDTLIYLAMDPRLMPGVSAEIRTLRSSASTPSLRSREGSITPMGRSDAPGGNVRVVVRVRGFLPRGKGMSLENEASINGFRRG